MKNIILFLGFTLIVSSHLFAQREMKLDDDWIQKIRAEKIAFLTIELQLTPEEAQNFWPLYNEFEQKRFEIHMKRRHMERNLMGDTEGVSDDELKTVSMDFINLFQQEADLMKETNIKFFEALPAKKVVQFYDVENDFKSHMLREYRKKKRGDGNR